MNVSGFDLNLLIAFDALLTEGSVTGAASRLGLSQPTLSHALSRLRNLVGDPLFERSRRGMKPTRRSLAMAEPIRAGLAEFRRALAPPAEAVPAKRAVSIAANAYAQCVLLPSVFRAIENSAPRMLLDVRSPEAASVGTDVAFSIDWARTAPGTADANDSAVALRDSLACIAGRGNRAFGARLTLDGFLRSEHVAVGSGDLATTDGVDSALSRLGRRRGVQIVVSDSLGAVLLVSRSDLVAVVPRRLAELFAPSLALRVFKPPLSLPDAVLEVTWPRRGGQDPAIMFLRARVLEAGRNLTKSPNT